MKILAIDPGNTQSAWILIDVVDHRPIAFAKEPNPQVLARLTSRSNGHYTAAIEMVASYGMAVGAEVFETCVWVGRFQQVLIQDINVTDVHLVKRHPIKLHHCHSAKANDSNITQALVDRFAHGQPNHGKGTKAQPGWFHGFFKDIWQAYALAVYAADTLPRKATA